MTFGQPHCFVLGKYTFERSRIRTTRATSGVLKHSWIEEHAMLTIIGRFVEDESGTTAIEYGLIGTLISVAIIAGATTLGNTLNETFQGLSDNMNDARNAHGS
jgi:pilus assembly protein Flp/PilA